MKNELITQCQHAFWITGTKDLTKSPGAIFLDFSAAFDAISHHFLFARLNCYGFTHLTLSLSCRRQKSGYFSDCGDIVGCRLVALVHSFLFLQMTCPLF